MLDGKRTSGMQWRRCFEKRVASFQFLRFQVISFWTYPEYSKRGKFLVECVTGRTFQIIDQRYKVALFFAFYVDFVGHNPSVSVR